MTSLIEHTLRIDLAALNGYRPEGWVPVLRAELGGPVPPAAELVWRVRRPDGTAWIDGRLRVPELSTSDRCGIELRADAAAGECTQAGRVSFELRLVSALEGVDELLLADAFDVLAVPPGEAADGAGRFEVDETWRLDSSEFALDVVDEPDAPRLVVRAWLPGDVGVHELEAHLFWQGVRIARATAVNARFDSTANDGTVVGRGIELIVGEVRGWNNLAASGWGGDWHLLDAHDGAYEVRVVHGVSVVRTIPFEVAAGRLVGVVDAETTYAHRTPTESTDASVADADATYANRTATESTDASVVDAATASAHHASTESATASVITGAVDVVDESTLQPYVDRAERLLATWEAEVASAVPPFDSQLVLQAEAVLRERPGYAELDAAAAALPDSRPALLLGEPIELGVMRARTAALFAAAEALLGSSAQAAEDELAPYRAVLRADKLAIFEEHPAPAFEYLTTDRRIITTPAELAEAEFWYFEGALDVDTTATVSPLSATPSSGAATITATTRHWTVLAHRFAPDHTLLDRDETRGPGPTAPLTAFRWRP